MANEPIVEALKVKGIQQNHVNKWVAVVKKTGKLLTVGDSLSEVLDRSSSTQNKTVFKVLPQFFVGG